MSPFLVIESGATKLSWQLATANKRLANGQQDGLHPQLVGSAQWQIQLLDLARTLPIAPKRIFYYGTGCMSTQGRHQVTAYFKKFWQPPYELTVETDLLGACRAVCQQSEGLVAILGTGSNTAVYKNERIVQQRGGLGYVLGDEGSGAHLGNNLLKAFLQNELPEPLAHALHQRYHLDRGAVIEALYRGAAPSRF
ncbi:MAG: ATPase, partial [Bacteroidota bacterium]